MMTYNTIQVDTTEEIIYITIDRLKDNNALNDALINELMDVITGADSAIKAIVLQGQNGLFCTGMDFKQFATNSTQLSYEQAYDFSAHYFELLSTLSTIDKLIVIKLDGKVLAGGVGLVAAADLVYSSERTTFSLSEALWGLLPANVMPFLLRKVGHQMAYRMTLTADTLTAEEAKKCHLIDEILTDIDTEFAMKLMKIKRLHQETILDLKNYFNALNPISEEKKQLAISTLARLVVKPRIQNNVKTFIQTGAFPWS